MTLEFLRMELFQVRKTDNKGDADLSQLQANDKNFWLKWNEYDTCPDATLIPQYQNQEKEFYSIFNPQSSITRRKIQKNEWKGLFTKERMNSYNFLWNEKN